MLVTLYVAMRSERWMLFFHAHADEKIRLSAYYETAPRIYRASLKMGIALLKAFRYTSEFIWPHTIEALDFSLCP